MEVFCWTTACGTPFFLKPLQEWQQQQLRPLSWWLQGWVRPSWMLPVLQWLQLAQLLLMELARWNSALRNSQQEQQHQHLLSQLQLPHLWTLLVLQKSIVICANHLAVGTNVGILQSPLTGRMRHVKAELWAWHGVHCP
jgi:hypothetical protein